MCQTDDNITEMSKKLSTLQDQLRRIIDKSGMSRYEIANAAGLDHATMSRFYTGERGLSMAALESLAEVLKIKLISAKRSK
jgi:transcriptional regulator with XRE-family HTH domain